MKKINIINSSGEVFYYDDETKQKGFQEGFSDGFPEGKQFLNVADGTCCQGQPLDSECLAYIENVLQLINQ